MFATIAKLLGNSRKVKLALLGAVLALAASVLVVVYPTRADAILTISGMVYSLLAVVVGGITFEDSVTKWANRPRYSADLEGLLKQLTDAAKLLADKTENEPPSVG